MNGRRACIAGAAALALASCAKPPSPGSAASTASGRQRIAPPTASASDVPESSVATDHGVVIGVDLGATVAFRGIPYASPPVGEKRFTAPIDPPSWSALRDAAAWGACCPQLHNGEVVGSEDCLTLNVWIPKAKSDGRRPVLVFLHGGGNIEGCAAQELFGDRIYEGDALAAAKGAVVVTLNYRLAALGFLEHDGIPTNLGVRDQIAALGWVERNIGAFGGDPSRVLLFGESAGAEDTCVHVASPRSKGLFSRALMESGLCPGGKFCRGYEIDRQVSKIASKLGCGGR